MSADQEIRELKRSVGELVIELAAVRDAFLKVPGGEARLMEVEEVVDSLRGLEAAAYEYLEQKAGLLQKKPDGPFIGVLRSALQSSRMFMQFAREDAALKTFAPDGTLTADQKLLMLQSRAADTRLSSETRQKVERALELSKGLKRAEFLNRYDRNAPNH